ncbi:hypothetical protein ABNC45_12790 [Paenibacillus larvae]
MKKLIIRAFLLLALFISVSAPAMAAPFQEIENQDRASTKYDSSAYDLMSYSDASWYQLLQKGQEHVGTTIRNFSWSAYIQICKLTFMFIFQLFSLDIVKMTKDSVMQVTSSTAGALVTNFSSFAIAIAAVGILVRAYIKQNWEAFFKLLLNLVLCLVLLFSMQTKKFNFIDIAHGLTTTLENAIITVNPTLNEKSPSSSGQGDMGYNIAVSIENKVFDALLYKPYLLLQYGTTNEQDILKQGSDRISSYLDADPYTQDGAEKREAITENEFKVLKNRNIFAANAMTQTSYILIMIISSIVQGIVYFALALLRVFLQFGFIIFIAFAPVISFVAMFPMFERLVSLYLKSLFLLILYKGITMFIVLLSTSFISMSYDMTNMSSDIYYRIFVQLVFCVCIIVMYAKRHFLMNMLNGAEPNLADVGGSAVSTKGAARTVGTIYRFRERMRYSRPPMQNMNSRASGIASGFGKDDGKAKNKGAAGGNKGRSEKGTESLRRNAGKTNDKTKPTTSNEGKQSAAATTVEKEPSGQKQKPSGALEKTKEEKSQDTSRSPGKRKSHDSQKSVESRADQQKASDKQRLSRSRSTGITKEGKTNAEPKQAAKSPEKTTIPKKEQASSLLEGTVEKTQRPSGKEKGESNIKASSKRMSGRTEIQQGMNEAAAASSAASYPSQPKTAQPALPISNRKEPHSEKRQPMKQEKQERLEEKEQAGNHPKPEQLSPPRQLSTKHAARTASRHRKHAQDS